MSLRFSGSIRFRLKPSVRCILFRVSEAEGLGLFPTQWAVFGSFGRPKELPLLRVMSDAEGLG